MVISSKIAQTRAQLLNQSRWKHEQTCVYKYVVTNTQSQFSNVVQNMGTTTKSKECSATNKYLWIPIREQNYIYGMNKFTIAQK